MRITYKTLRRVINNSAEYLRQLIKTIVRSNAFMNTDRRAVVDLEEVNVPRRLNQICWLLRQAGYSVMVRIGWRAFTGFNRIGKDGFKDPNTFLTPFRMSRSYLMVTDEGGGSGIGRKEALFPKTLRIDYTFYPPDTKKFKDNCYIPIMFHPSLMNADTYARAAGLAHNSNRKVSIFFAGSLTRDKYDREVIRSQYGLLTRNEMIDAVMSGSGERGKPFAPRDFRDFQGRKDRGELADKTVIIDTGVCKIPQDRWLDVLSEVDFFLAAPGISMPFCHNLPESMAVGAIPVIQFGDLLYPPLEDRKTCLAFDSLDELKDIVTNVIPAMRPDEIGEMRERVVQYHRQYLSPESFVARMKQFEEDSRRELRLIMARRMYTD
ncbi:MAG: hypothetical protein SVR04_06845 [Spirochaetota bacterium]|nr:hypothetical protein [Spirochaetota bacterium]